MHAGCYAMNPIGPQTVPGEWVARLASLVHTIRPDWDEPGIRSALAKVAGRPLLDVTHAAIAATRRIDQRTPAIIATDGKHWPGADEAQRTHAEPGIVTYCEHGRPGALHCNECQPPVERTGPTPEQREQMRRAIRGER